MSEIRLTDEQIKFIADCEEEYKDRFTDKDEEFMKVKNVQSKDPPIMDPWYNNQPRDSDWSRQNQGHDHGGRRNQGGKRRHDRYDRYDRHNDHHHNYKRYSSN